MCQLHGHIVDCLEGRGAKRPLAYTVMTISMTSPASTAAASAACATLRRAKSTNDLSTA